MQGYDLAVVSLLKATTGMLGEQQAVLLHLPVDALVVDPAPGRSLSLQKCGDPLVAIGGPLINQTADLRRKP